MTRCRIPMDIQLFADPAPGGGNGGLRPGIDAKTVSYVMKMADLSGAVGQDGEIKLPRLSVSGYRDYHRNTLGYNSGNYSN